MARIGRIAAVTIALFTLLAVSLACTPKPESKPQPKVAPPAVKTVGVLVAGVDLSTPPFAGVDQGRQAGIDVDVAGALADKLGLAIKYVDVKPSEAATALAEGTADVVLSVPYADTSLSQLNLAGAYIADAPALFIATDSTASVDPSMTLSSIVVPSVAAQRESPAYWILRQQIDPEVVQPYDTLREAMQALVDGKAPLLAGDAIVGDYIARDFPTVRYAGRIGPASVLGAAVSVDNTTLGDAVRTALDELSTDGVLETVRRKWLGNVPEIPVEASTESTAPQ
jgi:ABC-type amino acid transport substrate-binding protein